MKHFLSLVMFLTSLATLHGAEPKPYNDPSPKRYELTARASQIDSRTRPHPEIEFVFEKAGKPQDVQHAFVDTRVPPRGKLVIWLMGHNGPLFERLSGYGLHSIQVHYANGWFGKLNKEPPPGGDEKYLGKIRLEAATGEDFSDAINIPQPDGMTERAFQFVKWLAKENPQGRWEQFLTADGRGLRWDNVIMAGISHGSTTAARFAIHQKVDRVVMFSGARARGEVDHRGGYDPILRQLGRLKVGHITMEFTSPGAGDMSVFQKLPEDVEIGLGCVSCQPGQIDSAETIVERVEMALRYVSPSRITLNTDCGFAPGSAADVSLDEVYIKLKNEVAAAQCLRDKHG